MVDRYEALFEAACSDGVPAGADAGAGVAGATA